MSLHSTWGQESTIALGGVVVGAQRRAPRQGVERATSGQVEILYGREERTGDLIFWLRPQVRLVYLVN